MLAAVRSIYRQSKKRQDDFWTEWVTRPVAAVFVHFLRATSVTPNQVTFVSVTVFAAAAALLVGWRSHVGLVAAALTAQLSYVLDCTDGQLARIKSMSTPVGALLDFMMDEFKALMLIGAGTTRMWMTTGEARWLLLGVGGLFAAASGMTLTSFIRRPEYLKATGARPASDGDPPARRSPAGWVLFAVERAGKFVFQYPTYFIVLSVLDRLDVLLYAYMSAHLLYLGRTGLIVLVKLGRR
jgi:phosphatidylglycerophosphate synthase